MLLLVLVTSLFLNAQAPTGIHGTVTDSSGAPLPGASVVAMQDGRAVAGVLTDVKGEFILALAPGGYVIRITLIGYATFSRNVGVIDGRQVRITATLQTTPPPPPPPPPLGTAPKPAPLAGMARQKAPAASPVAVSEGVAGGAAGGVAAGLGPARYRQDYNTEAYDHVEENSWTPAATRPLSTFSIDVDTASYANVRRFLNQGSMPPPDAVRVEELINYFAYEYPEPRGKAPFSVTTEVAPCPWNEKHRIALIGLQGRRIAVENLPPRNLVFLIDVSGSMQHPQKLPLVKAALSMLAGHLTARDRVAIAVYAGASGLVLPSTRGDDREAILAAIADLEAGGSTNGGEGLRLAYRVAQEHLTRDGVNRVVLATDGDFNIGVTNQGELVRLIEEERERGVSLSVLGFGMGNYKDSTLEKLADKGNGNYAYIDTLQEAQKVLVTDAGGTLITIAKDVKIQVEFNPQAVTAYRLVGYENRRLEDQDFNDDKKDAGEIGAGHSVTALYEIVPPGTPIELPGIDPLKYQRQIPSGAHADELLTVKVRYKEPDGERSALLEFPVPAAGRETLSATLGFASAVAEFGMLLRKSPFKGSASYSTAAERARRFRGADPHGHRAELIRLMGLAQELGRSATH